jgi:hypothetical protein
MATTTNYGWTTPDDTALVKDGAAAIRTLGTSVDTTTKNLNPETTLGDIAYRSSTSNVNTRLGIGTTGQVLAVSGGVPAWSTISSGGMTLLSTTTLSGSTTTISSISGDYTDLQIVGRGIDLNTGDDLYLRLNGNTGNNYTRAFFKLTANTVSGSTSAVTSSLFFGSAGDNSDYNVAGVFVINIPRYSATELHQIYSVNRSYAGGNHLFYHMAGVFDSAAAITSITIFTAGGATFDAGTVYVYGVK